MQYTPKQEREVLRCPEELYADVARFLCYLGPACDGTPASSFVSPISMALMASNMLNASSNNSSPTCATATVRCSCWLGLHAAVIQGIECQGFQHLELLGSLLQEAVNLWELHIFHQASTLCHTRSWRDDGLSAPALLSGVSNGARSREQTMASYCMLIPFGMVYNLPKHIVLHTYYRTSLSCREMAMCSFLHVGGEM